METPFSRVGAELGVELGSELGLELTSILGVSELNRNLYKE